MDPHVLHIWGELLRPPVPHTTVLEQSSEVSLVKNDERETPELEQLAQEKFRRRILLMKIQADNSDRSLRNEV